MKIILRMPNWIGDFVMATALLEDVRHMYPGAKIAALCSGRLGDLLENNPYVDEVISFSRKRRFFPKGLLSKLRREKYDLGILLTHSFSSAWHFWAGGVKKRVGFYRPLRAFLLSENLMFPREKEHLVKTYKRLIHVPGDAEPRIFILPKGKKIGKTVVGVHPGAAYGSAKCFPPEKFRAVVDRFLKEVPGSEIYFFGDLQAKPLIDEICKGFGEEVKNLAGKTSLKELVQEIGGCDLFLTNDSGPMHIAASLKVPLVALFGSTDPLVTGPYDWGKVIYKKVACSPCYKRVCPIDFRCMREIPIDEVVQEMKKALLVPILRQTREEISFEGAKEPAYVTEGKASTRRAGVIILAAGMGRRLGFSKPKGCLEIQGKSLFEILLEKVTGPVAIMTSPATHEETRAFLQAKGYFSVDLFQERCLPRLSLLYEESPEGNGALFKAFYGSTLWEKWKEVEEFRIIPIDNPLATPLECGDEELTLLVIEKMGREEKLGALMEKEKKLYICEYSEIPEGQKDRLRLAYSGIFSCTRKFFERAAMFAMPWHTVTRNGVKHFEQFVFDAFPLAESYQIILKTRKDVFHPIKTKEDLVYYASLTKEA